MGQPLLKDSNCIYSRGVNGILIELKSFWVDNGGGRELLYGESETTLFLIVRAESKGAGVATANKFENTIAAKRVVLNCWKVQIAIDFYRESDCRIIEL